MQRGLWQTGSVPGAVELAFGRVGEGPELVLALHGITAQHRAFSAFARHLQRNYPDGVVGLDLRGRGDSGKPPPGNYGLTAHAGDVVRTLDHLNLKEGVLAGHSMGAFVALQAALLYPERVKALVLLDGGWPRPEEVNEDEAEALRIGLQRAFKRLDMAFEASEDYLDYWFPGQSLALENLPPDLADYYRYDLERTDGGYSPKASREAAEEDAASVASESPTIAGMKDITCPVALVRAAEGFFPGSAPLFTEAARYAVAEVLDLRSETLLSGADHYTMLLIEEHARQAAGAVEEFLRRL